MKNLQHHGHSASGDLDRLEKLIQERLAPGADKAQIDDRIWDVFGEEWAVMFTDLAGFSRRVADFGIIHFLQTIAESRRIFAPCIDAFDGILVKVEGDSLLLLFKRAESAVQCAIAMQRQCRDYNHNRSDEEKILLCLGIGYGRVLKIGSEDVFGAEVNAAAKLGEDTARPWEILITASVADKVRDLPELQFEQIDYIPHGANAAFRLGYTL